MNLKLKILRSVFILFMVWTLCCCAENSPAVEGEEGVVGVVGGVVGEGESLSATVYRSAVAKADFNKNFVVAPKQIEELVQHLKATKFDLKSEIVFENQSKENTDGNSSHISQREEFNSDSKKIIEIVNKIVIYKEDKNHNNNITNTVLNHFDDLVEKLPNSQIEHRRSSAAALNSSAELFNSFSLHARWAFNFQKRDTQKLFFYNSPRQRVLRDIMRKDDVFRFGRLDDLNASALELRLHDSEHSLLVVLPQEIDGLAALEEQLSDVTLLEDIVNNRLKPTLVRVFMPKFKFVHRVELHELIKLTHLDPMVTKIQHEATMMVSEDGLGSLGRRTVLFWNAYSSLRTTPQIFEMNHPFFFIVRNNNNNDIQCVGHLARL